MNKTELVKACAAKANVSEKQCKAVIDAAFEAAVEALQNGDKVSIPGYLTAQVKVRPARTCRNPKDGSSVEVPEKKVVAVKAGAKIAL